MLAEFQRALADLTAAPALCRAARADPALLSGRYRLTAREAARLNAVVGSRGMEANCMLWRANRLAPIALNLPDTCEALRGCLTALLDAFWTAVPTPEGHFLVEADRFARFLAATDLPAPARAALAAEHPLVIARLARTRAAAADAAAP